jgi:tetratricopeptide (TPR) repeat protein
MKPSHSPILYEYLKRYQEDPTSRVFAPLAEAYRKAGMIEEAIEIAREGLRVHPNFLGGKVALARALFDHEEYCEVLSLMQDVVREAPDNLVAQRLLAESALLLGLQNEALQAYKMLLYYQPQDAEVGKIVEEIEEQAYQQGGLLLRTDPRVLPSPEEDVSHFQVSEAREAMEQDAAIRAAKRLDRLERVVELLVRVRTYRWKLANRVFSHQDSGLE